MNEDSKSYYEGHLDAIQSVTNWIEGLLKSLYEVKKKFEEEIEKIDKDKIQ